MNKLVAIPAIALAAGMSLSACGSWHANVNDPTHAIPTTPAPTHTVTVTPAPKPAPTHTVIVTPPHAGEVYCTYKQMDTAICTNGGYVTVPSSAYNQALAENPTDPGSVLSGWFPLSQVQNAPVPTSGNTNCNGGTYQPVTIWAGPNTSCPFALNVAANYTGTGAGLRLQSCYRAALHHDAVTVLLKTAPWIAMAGMMRLS